MKTENSNNVRSAFILFILALGVAFGCTGCYSTRNETWHCYDRNGKPVEGVLIICQYGLAHYHKQAVNHRFTDVNGKVLLDFDNDTPRELPRDFDCVYSPTLHSGAIMAGKRWHEGQPIPNDTVYFDEWNNRIYFKSGVDDPVIWHSALNALIYAYSLRTGLLYGGKALKSGLSDFVHSERALFLEKYGAVRIPEAYLQELRRQASWDDTRFKNNRHPSFYEVTLPISEQ